MRGVEGDKGVGVISKTKIGGKLARLAVGTGFRFHVGAQDGVDAGLVAAAVFLQPLHDVVVNSDGEAVFGFRHGEPCGLPEGFTEPGMSEKSMSASRIARNRLKSVAPFARVPEVVCVVFPFIAMCPPGRNNPSAFAAHNVNHYDLDICHKADG